MTTNQIKSAIPWVLIICGCMVSVLTFGPRSAMGLFQLPILSETGWSRTTFGLAMALQNLFWGLGQPVFGAIADKFGTWRVLTMSAVLLGVGLFTMALADAPIWLHIGGGVLVGLGVAAGSFGIILSAFARNVAPENRSLVFGLATAAGSAGMFIFAPISQGLIDSFGWSDTLIFISIAMLAIPLLAIPLRGNAASGSQSAQEYDQTVREALREAFGYHGYRLLTAGFFVCGFHVAFIAAHFPAYLGDIGMSANYAVLAIAMIGFFNIIGSLASGIIGQRRSKSSILVWLYLSRAVVISLFLLVPPSGFTVIVFSITMGLLWLSTVPPTNGLVAIMFGTRHLGMLGGIVFLSHQIGSFLGVWAGGYLHDRLGSYDPVWWLGVALSLFAALINWPIQDKAVERPAVAAAA